MCRNRENQLQKHDEWLDATRPAAELAEIHYMPIKCISGWAE